MMYTATDMREMLREEYGNDAPGSRAAKVVDTVNRWLARGDGIAIYRNEDLGHPDLGATVLVSYGQGSALSDPPPVTLPDFPDQINWRYRLQGTYRGTEL